MNLYPWLEQIAARLQQRRTDGCFPHALLIAGAPGTGKRQLADHLVRLLLCEQSGHSDGDSQGGCGQCRYCHWLDAGSHPDFSAVEPAGDSSQIRIDQIRELIAKLSLTATGNGIKAALLAPAEAMNINAANALLKTLEEPTPDAIILLVSSQPHRLPVTIRSRCQRVDVTAPDSETAIQWLQQNSEYPAQTISEALGAAAGAPLAALALLENQGLALRQEVEQDLSRLLEGKTDVISIAERWKQQDMEPVWQWVVGLLQHLIRNRCTRTGTAGFEHADRHSLQRLFGLLEQAQSARQLVRTPVRQDLLVIDWLVAWQARGG